MNRPIFNVVKRRRFLEFVRHGEADPGFVLTIDRIVPGGLVVETGGERQIFGDFEVG